MKWQEIISSKAFNLSLPITRMEWDFKEEKESKCTGEHTHLLGSFNV